MNGVPASIFNASERAFRKTSVGSEISMGWSDVEALIRTFSEMDHPEGPRRLERARRLAAAVEEFATKPECRRHHRTMRARGPLFWSPTFSPAFTSSGETFRANIVHQPAYARDYTQRGPHLAFNACGSRFGFPSQFATCFPSWYSARPCSSGKATSWVLVRNLSLRRTILDWFRYKASWVGRVGDGRRDHRRGKTVTRLRSHFQFGQFRRAAHFSVQRGAIVCRLRTEFREIKAPKGHLVLVNFELGLSRQTMHHAGRKWRPN